MLVRCHYVSGLRASPLLDVMTRCHVGGGVVLEGRGPSRAIWHLGGSKLVTRKLIKLFQNVDTPRYSHTQVIKSVEKYATNLVKQLLKAGGMEYTTKEF